MAKGKKGFEKGVSGNPNGRAKGSPNRTTKEARELLEQILFGQIDNVNDALDKIRKKSEDRYIDAMSKLFKYVLPQKTDVTSNDKPIISLPDIIIKTKSE